MKMKDAYEIMIQEYLSKCNCCDECFASYYCTYNGKRETRTPEDYCVENIKEYFRRKGH